LAVFRGGAFATSCQWLSSREVDEAIDLYAREQVSAGAEQALLDVVADGPTWEHLLFIAPIELCPESSASLN